MNEPKIYVRCKTCLATACIASKEWKNGAVCGICDGHFEHIGEVKGQPTWVRKEVLCKCDDRCVCARGPSCDCQCGGENHGSGMAGFVEVVAETGRVRITPAKNAAKHLAQAVEYRAARQAFIAGLAPIGVGLSTWEDFKKGTWIERSQWNICRQASFLLDKASGARSHAGRMKILTKKINL